MLEAKVGHEAGETVIWLKGSLNEDAGGALAQTLDALRATPSRSCIAIDCAGIQAINSPGVALWLSFIDRLSRTYRTVFRNCSIFFVDYLNMVQSLAQGGEVISFFAPFHCSACGKAAEILLETKTVAETSSLGSQRCPGCGGALAQDIATEDYCAFLFA
jgi:ABC-type transporter Mla MlaB component